MQPRPTTSTIVHGRGCHLIDGDGCSAWLLPLGDDLVYLELSVVDTLEWAGPVPAAQLLAHLVTSGRSAAGLRELVDRVDPLSGGSERVR